MERGSINSKLFKKREEADSGNYRGVTLLSIAGKTFRKILNNIMEKKDNISEEHAGFRLSRSRVDHAYTLGNVVQYMKDAG